MNFTLGTDPEFFIFDKSQNKIISSDGIIPGVKGDPFRPKDLPEGYGLEVDNILGEFNIPPAHSREEWISYNKTMKAWIANFLKEANPNYEMLHKASAFIDEDQLQSDVAKLFGCSVDYNAYTKKENPKPEGTSTNLRSCGMHLHLGFDRKLSVKEKLALIKLLDLYVGVPSVVIDQDTMRRSLYGKAGCFRMTSYGFEYRTLSGVFLKDEYLGWIYDKVSNAVRAFEIGAWLDGEKSLEIQEIINTGNIEKALKNI